MRDRIKSRDSLAHFFFQGFKYCEIIDLSKLDTSAVTNMSYMFKDCSSLESLDLSGWDTSRVADMQSMFYECSSLASLDVSRFDTSSARDMSGMFSGCSSLASLDLSGFDTSKVADMSFMFSGCSSLGLLDLSKLDISAVKGMSFMFTECDSLIRIVLPAMGSRKLGQELPYGTWTHESGQSFIPDNFPDQLSGVYEFSPCESSDDIQQSAVGSAQHAPISIAKAKVVVADKTYMGKTLKPSSVSVKVGGKTLVAGRDYTVRCKGGKAVGIYKVTIKGKGAYTGAKTATFSILPKATSITKAKAAKRGFAVSWKKPSKANLKQTTGYKVQWSTDKKFKKGVKSKLVKKNKTTSLKVPKLKGGKKYYVRVCTYKKVGGKYYYSSWSKAKAVKTKK